MFLERIETDGLAHFSYIVGSGREAAVIDPRRDCDIYVERASAHGAAITHIFATHRNEDLISGAPILSERTHAPVWHGPDADGDVRYAKTVHEGDAFTLGGTCRLQVLRTPGHTYDSLSLVLFDLSTGQDPLGVFTGDALFIGDVGRTDFYPDEARKVAGLLFDSLQKLLALGDQTIVYPAHGAGSVCGGGMADRNASTIGYERRNNPGLQLDRDNFIAKKLAEDHHLPPYFARMERLNLEGAMPGPASFVPRPLDLKDVRERGDAWLVDTRLTLAFVGAHYPGALSLPLDVLASFAGSYLGKGAEIILCSSDMSEAEEATRRLARIGFDDVRGVAPSLVPAVASGEVYESLPVIDVDAVRQRLTAPPDDWTLLDVRSPDEIDAFAMADAREIYVGDLPACAGELETGRHVTVMCASGVRATVAASYLRLCGFRDVDVFLGSAGAWQARHA